jgi:hypothetical protein
VHGRGGGNTQRAESIADVSPVRSHRSRNSRRRSHRSERLRRSSSHDDEDADRLRSSRGNARLTLNL